MMQQINSSTFAVFHISYYDYGCANLACCRPGTKHYNVNLTQFCIDRSSISPANYQLLLSRCLSTQLYKSASAK